MSKKVTKYIPTLKEKETRARMVQTRLPMECVEKDCTITYYFYKFKDEPGGSTIVETDIEWHDEPDPSEDDKNNDNEK